MNSAQEGQKGRRSRSKRHEVLAAATDRFGRDGYEHTKWADIAADVGVGPTALYHYFESKQHCLYEIMDRALAGFHDRFEVLTRDEAADPLDALVAIVDDTFRLSEHDVQRNRVLVAEQGLLSGRSGSPPPGPGAPPPGGGGRGRARGPPPGPRVSWGGFSRGGGGGRGAPGKTPPGLRPPAPP